MSETTAVNKQRISFSQYQMWKNCAHRWKLNYIDKVGTYQPSIATLFGTAMHEVLQSYIQVLYSKTVKEANELPMDKMLLDTMYKLYEQQVKENNDVHFTDKEQLAEYYQDGMAIIEWFKARRDAFFAKKDWELIGIELPIDVIPLDTHPTINLIGYLDLVMRNTKTGEIVIYDFKTSTRGWGKWATTDKVKISQLVLYKTFYSKQLGIDPDDIRVEYLILKRKVDPNAEWAAMRTRIQRFIPPHGKISQNKILNEVQTFISSNFNEDATVRTDATYPKTAGKDDYACKYCEFKDMHDLCDPNTRIRE